MHRQSPCLGTVDCTGVKCAHSKYCPELNCQGAPNNQKVGIGTKCAWFTPSVDGCWVSTAPFLFHEKFVNSRMGHSRWPCWTLSPGANGFSHCWGQVGRCSQSKVRASTGSGWGVGKQQDSDASHITARQAVGGSEPARHSKEWAMERQKPPRPPPTYGSSEAGVAGVWWGGRAALLANVAFLDFPLISTFSYFHLCSQMQ